jgi:hypothetical protein
MAGCGQGVPDVGSFALNLELNDESMGGHPTVETRHQGDPYYSARLVSRDENL